MTFDFDTYEKLFASLRIDPCALLGVDRDDLVLADIKKNYRKRIREAHPDRGAKSDSACKILNAAYQYLKELATSRDNIKKREYESSHSNSIFEDVLPHSGPGDIDTKIWPARAEISGPVTKWTPPAALPPATRMEYARVRQSGGILMVTDSNDATRPGTRLCDIRSAQSTSGSISDSYLTKRELVERQQSRTGFKMPAPTMSFKESCEAMERQQGLVAKREALENRRFIQESAARMDEEKRQSILAALSMCPRRLTA